MQCRKECVSRECNPYRHLRRFTIANLTEQNLLRILPKCRAQSRDECQPRLRIYLKLADPIDAALHGILQRHDVAVRLIQRRESGIERRRLARVHRPAEEKQPRRAADQTLEDLLITWREVQLRTAQEPFRGIHDAHNHTLSTKYGEHRHAHIDQSLAIAVADLTILRAVALCRVDARHHLQPRNDDGCELRRELNGTLSQKSIHAHADAQAATHRLEVNICRLLCERRL